MRIRVQTLALVALTLAVVACGVKGEKPNDKGKDPAVEASEEHVKRVEGLYYPGAKKMQTEWGLVGDGRVKQRILVTDDDATKVYTWYAKKLGWPGEHGEWMSVSRGRPGTTPPLDFTLGGSMDSTNYFEKKIEDQIKRPVELLSLTIAKPKYTLTVIINRGKEEKQTTVALTYIVIEGLEDAFKK